MVQSVASLTGGSKQSKYNGNGNPMLPGGFDGIGQFQPQSAGLGPGGKVGGMYGGMSGLPYGGQSPKYGIGGLQFGGVPGTNGAGKYGNGAGSPYGPSAAGKQPGKYGNGFGSLKNGGQQQALGSNANSPGKYGYGRMPYEIQTAGQSPKAKPANYGSAYQPQPAEFGQGGKANGKYGGSQVPYAPQGLGAGSDAKSAGKYGGQGSYKTQPLESAVTSANLPYQSLPLEAAGGKSYGETPTPAAAVGGASIDRYDNVGYISGQVQPEVVAFPAAPTTPSPSAAPYLPVDAAVTAYEAGVDSGVKSIDSVTESQAAAQGSEQTDEVQQMPQQIHIQQHLKLHFHPQGGNDGKYDLNGFFGNGNGGYKG